MKILRLLSLTTDLLLIVSMFGTAFGLERDELKTSALANAHGKTKVIAPHAHRITVLETGFDNV